MKLFQVTFGDGRVERVEADAFWVNDWAVVFAHEERRESKAWNAKPGDVTVKMHTFRVIAGREVKEVREIPG